MNIQSVTTSFTYDSDIKPQIWLSQAASEALTNMKDFGPIFQIPEDDITPMFVEAEKDMKIRNLQHTIDELQRQRREALFKVSQLQREATENEYLRRNLQGNLDTQKSGIEAMDKVIQGLRTELNLKDIIIKDKNEMLESSGKFRSEIFKLCEKLGIKNGEYAPKFLERTIEQLKSEWHYVHGEMERFQKLANDKQKELTEFKAHFKNQLS